MLRQTQTEVEASSKSGGQGSLGKPRHFHENCGFSIYVFSGNPSTTPAAAGRCRCRGRWGAPPGWGPLLRRRWRPCAAPEGFVGLRFFLGGTVKRCFRVGETWRRFLRRFFWEGMGPVFSPLFFSLSVDQEERREIRVLGSTLVPA